jgi:hypothetical protein
MESTFCNSSFRLTPATNMAEKDNMSLLELYCLVRDMEATNALSSEVTSVACAFVEHLSATDQLKLTTCGWSGTFERSITSSDIQGLLPTDSHTGSPAAVALREWLLPTNTNTNASHDEYKPRQTETRRPLISLPYGYKAPAEFDVDNTFSGPGHVLLWAKQNGLWPKKGDVTQWNWFFNDLLGRAAAPRARVVRKEFINDRLQRLAYPITFSHRKADSGARFAKSKVRAKRAHIVHIHSSDHNPFIIHS